MPAQTFKSSNLIMGEPVTFGQRYTYAADHALAVMTAKDYFNPARSRLRAGDTIRVLQLEHADPQRPDNRVVSWTDLLVQAVGADGVEVVDERPAVTVPEPKAKPKTQNRRARERYVEDSDAKVVEEDDGTFAVETSDGRFTGLKSLVEAQDIAAGAAPLPQ